MRTVRLFVAGLLAVLIGPPALAAACAGFSDVDSGNTTYCSAVSYLKDKGVTLGCTGSTYCPNQYVTRLQMALFLQRFGRGNQANTVYDNTATAAGDYSSATQPYSAVSGGFDNTASGAYSVVAGGSNNVASAYLSTVLGGFHNVAAGLNSVAAGSYAQADQPFCMVLDFWGTSTPMNCIGSGNIVRVGSLHGLSVDYYSQRPDGGGTRWFGVGDIFAGQTISTWTGAYLSDDGVWVNKPLHMESKGELVESVDAQAVLDKVARMPIRTWHSKQGEREVHHMGPTTEDFWESFGVGYGPQTIADLDARGVALAAIQGLHAQALQKDARIVALEREMAEVRAQVAALTH